jgi:hypothetical protein
VTAILELFHQLLGDFFFGLGEAAADAQPGVGLECCAAPEGPAPVLFGNPFFSPLWPLLSPEGVELRAAQFVILEQELFDLLHLWRDLREPNGDGLFLDAFDALNGRQRIAVG